MWPLDEAQVTEPASATGRGPLGKGGEWHLHPSEQTISVKFPCADKSFSLECQTKANSSKTAKQLVEKQREGEKRKGEEGKKEGEEGREEARGAAKGPGEEEARV